VISARGITHTYPNGVRALEEVSLTLDPGERVALIGPSGCGKSTLLRILAGLQSPATGLVTLESTPMTQPDLRVRLMFQDAALLPWRTVAQNIGLPAELSGATAQARVDGLIKLTGLSGFEASFPDQLSGGMAQRVSLARAMLSQPPVLLLDEPFGALDALTRETLLSAVIDMTTAADTTVLMVTHSLSEAVFFANRVLVMSARPGRIKQMHVIDLPQPRTWDMQREPAFGQQIGALREMMASP
jgi:NitT/TauT family transport system ATP-binding protein